MITHAQQIDKLRRYLEQKVLPCSAYYRELFAKNNLKASDIRTWDDLQKIPFTSKKELLTTPEHPQRSKEFALVPEPEKLKRRPSVILSALLRGRTAAQAELESEYRPIFLTSTTGRSAEPVPFVYSQHDIDNLCRTGRRMIEVFGTHADDRILNMFPYAPHLAFWQTHYATMTFQLFSVSTGGGKVMGTEGNIRLLKKLKPSALIGMPTFQYHFLRQALDEGVHSDQIRTLVLGGEKVPEGMRQKLRALCAEMGSPDVTVLATYGFTEAKMAWAECPTQDGSPSGYHLYPDLGLVEIVNPETGRPQPDGAGGEIVFSALDSRGTVVIRYRTGDCIEGGIVHEPCPHCGRDWPRLVGNISRRSDVTEMKFDKLKGTVIDFNELEHLLDEIQEIGTWQLELRKLKDDPLEMDELILHAEKTGSGDDAGTKQHITETFAAATELRLNQISFHTAAEMRNRHGVGSEIKEKRVVDNRPKDGKPAPPRN